MNKLMLTSVALAIALPLAAAANPVQDSYRATAKQENAGFKDFSATRGQAFYSAKTGDMASLKNVGSALLGVAPLERRPERSLVTDCERQLAIGVCL